MRKFLAINGSIKGAKGATYLMLTKFGEGIEKAGGQLDILNLVDCEINRCIGCFHCWKGDGSCSSTDDMIQIINKIQQCDVMVIASSLYCHNVSSYMKDFLDRYIMISSEADVFLNENDEYVHTLRNSIPPLVVLSSCNFSDYHSFDAMSVYMNTIAKHLFTDIIAEIYRTQASVLKVGTRQQIVIDAYYKQLKIAGEELATNLELTEETKKYLRRRLIRRRFYFDFLEKNRENRFDFM